MLGEQALSVSDRIQGELETREVYLAGGNLNLSESLAVSRHSAYGFEWGDGGSGAAQRAVAVLPRATNRASAVAHNQAFKWEVIAHLAQADFTLALSTVRAVSILRPRSTQQSRTSDDASDSARRPRRIWTAGPAGRFRHGHCGTTRRIARSRFRLTEAKIDHAAMTAAGTSTVTSR